MKKQTVIFYDYMIKKNLMMMLSIFVIALLLQGCTEKNSNVISNNDEHSTREKSKETNPYDSNTEKTNKLELKKVAEGKEVQNYFYSPNRLNYFKEVNLTISGEMGEYLMAETYLNKETSPVSNAYFIELEKNLSPNPVIWLNNEQALVVTTNDGSGEFNMYIHDIKNNTKKNIGKPEAENIGYVYYSSDYNSQLKTVAFFMNYRGTASVYTYDLTKSLWNKVFSYTMPQSEAFYNVVWGNDHHLYFDVLEYQNSNEISKIIEYDFENERQTIFKKNAKILNSSPDKRYISYLDYNERKTVVFDFQNNTSLELPYSKIVEWHPNKNEFLSIESEQKIRVNQIKNNELEVQKYDVSKEMNEKNKIYNVRYAQGHILFDVVNLDYFERKYTTLIFDIKNVKTYQFMIR